jgi:hypothetical protein
MQQKSPANRKFRHHIFTILVVLNKAWVPKKLSSQCCLDGLHSSVNLNLIIDTTFVD